MYYAIRQGVDVWEYHDIMYAAALKDGVNIEDAEVLAGRVRGLLDHEDFLAELMSGTYEQEVRGSNIYAWGQVGLNAVPSFHMEGRKLDAIEDVGVTKQQLADFLRSGQNEN
jgi:predicted DsbA family dithiol-disulfide isomerase